MSSFQAGLSSAAISFVPAASESDTPSRSAPSEASRAQIMEKQGQPVGNIAASLGLPEQEVLEYLDLGSDLSGTGTSTQSSLSIYA